jgi:hypothetical protein
MIFVIDNYLFSVENLYKKSQSGGKIHGRSKKTCSQESRQSRHQTCQNRKDRQAREESRHPEGFQIRLQSLRAGGFRSGRLRLCHHGLGLLRNPDEEKKAAGQKIKPGCSIPSPESPPLFLTLKKPGDGLILFPSPQ